MNRRALLSALAVFLPICAHAGGVSIGGTRLVYDADQDEVNISVNNNDTQAPWLIQSWVDDFSDNNKSPFVITPPLFRLDAGKQNDLRIIKTAANLPKDRESIFWLNIKAIPAGNIGKSGNNILQFALKNRIKLFYRPVGLTPARDDADKKISWKFQDGKLEANNNTPYYLTLQSITFAGNTVKTDLHSALLPPFGHQDYAVKSGGSNQPVQWKGINDFGANTPLYSANTQ